MTLETDMRNGKLEEDVDKLSSMRLELQSLKKSYIDLIGGEELPFYFGKINLE